MGPYFLDYLKETFENLNGLNREKVRELYRESHLFFASLGEVIRSGGGQAKKDVLKLLSEIRQFLSTKVQQIGDPNPGVLSDEEVAVAQEMEESLDMEKKKKSKKVKKIKLKDMS